MPPDAEIPVLRILDANANRAVEGLRVVEEYARFALDDAFLSGQIKELRHRLAGAMATFFPDLLAARDTHHDVGTANRTTAEYRREDAEAVVRANWKRVEQALRVLEEYGKTDSPSAGEAFESCRYQAYQLERAMALETAHLVRLEGARLYVLVDSGPTPEAFEQRAEAIVAAGAHVVQLRDKQLSDRELIDRARRLRQITRGRALFIMNDRPDLAVLADADGVHVGQEELSVKDARTIVGPRRLVGVSTHTLAQARQAALDGASYIGCGPTFPSGTKSFEQLAGLDFLRAVAAEIRLPAFAIGGITLDTLPDVLQAGFTRVAVSGAIVKASDPGSEVAAWLSRLSASPPAPGG